MLRQTVNMKTETIAWLIAVTGALRAIAIRMPTMLPVPWANGALDVGATHGLGGLL